MLKKHIRLLLLIAFMSLPVLVYAATWSLNTWVKSAGGTIVVRGGTPLTNLDSSKFFNYTTSQPFNVTVTPNVGYELRQVNYNGVVTNTNNPGQTSYTVQGPTAQTVYATFGAQSIAVTASVSAGGAVNLTSLNGIYYGSTLSTARNFTFTPNTNFSVYSISGVPAGATVSPAFPAATNTPVTVTLPVGFTFTSNIALYGSFSGPPVARTGASQTVPPGVSATLDGSTSTGPIVGGVITGPVDSYLWNQTSGPGFPGIKLIADNTSGVQAIFTPTVLGSYAFLLTVTGGSTATTTVTVTNDAVAAARSTCQVCHQSSGIGLVQNVFGNWSSSSHKNLFVMCSNCHVGANTGGHPGSLTGGQVNETTFTYNAPFGSGNFCFTCHHTGNNLHYNTEAQLANICVACHNPNVHNPASTMTLSLGVQHFNGYTSTANPNYRAAYVTPNTQCTNCHITTANMPDVSDPALLNQRLDWAFSGHANTNGQPWLAYDFKTLSGCVQCHTTVGFIAYSTAKVTAAWGTASKTRDVLACNACHTDISSGALRTSNPIQPYADDIYTNPNVGNISNLCIKCHSGLQSGRSIKAKVAASADFTNLAFISSHSAAAAGILFKSIGYEFSGKDYSNKWHFKHDQIGISNYTAYNYDTGSDGPCAGCHMSSSNKHTFSPLAKNASGVITAITSPLCAGCHTGPAYLDAGRMNTREAKFAATLLALQKVLETKNIYYADVSPYFYMSSGNTAPGNAVTNWGNADTMGAAFNFNLLKHEPGAYAHNMIYAKRLIYDSIDILDNGVFDNSVGTTINGLSSLSATEKTTATGYLPLRP